MKASEALELAVGVVRENPPAACILHINGLIEEAASGGFMCVCVPGSMCNQSTLEGKRVMFYYKGLGYGWQLSGSTYSLYWNCQSDDNNA